MHRGWPQISRRVGGAVSAFVCHENDETEVIDSPHSRDLSGSGTTRAEDAQWTPDQSNIPPSVLVYEDKLRHVGTGIVTVWCHFSFMVWPTDATPAE